MEMITYKKKNRYVPRGRVFKQMQAKKQKQKTLMFQTESSKYC